MNKTLLTIGCIICGLFLFGFAQETKGTIFEQTVVAFDSQTQTVGGISATYITYDLYAYYDPGVYGELYYVSPDIFLDNDGGSGTNDYLYNYYPGYRVSFTTNNYRPNKILCTFSEHGLRTIYNPGPLQYYDPYQLSLISPDNHEGDYNHYVDNQHNGNGPESDFYSPVEYKVVDYTYKCLRTPTVSSVMFQATSDSPLTPNPIGDFGNGAVFGGGKRIFPDRLTPTDQVNHKTVMVRAQLADSGGSPAFTSGVKVYFRNFDVDDPSNDPAIDDNGVDGNDNRDGRLIGSPYPSTAAGRFSLCTATSKGCYALTDSNGLATATFEVTKRPGDNFVIAASTDETYLNDTLTDGIGIKDSSGQQLPTAFAKRTELLTVWVKIHLEVDSMGPVGNNLVTGRLTRAGATIGDYPTWVDVDPNPRGSDLLRARFTNGQITLGSYRFGVADNETRRIAIYSLDGGTYSIPGNTVFQLFDDDDFNDNDQPPPLGDGTLDGDDGEDVTYRGNTMFDETFSLLQPSANISQNVYAAAYIEPDYTWAENQFGMNDSNVQYETVTYTAPLFNEERRVINSQRDSIGLENNEFWIGYILIGYQATAGDVDPPPDVLGGTSPPIAYAYPPVDFIDIVTDSRDVPRGAIGSIIYIEQMRDGDKSLMNNEPNLKFKLRTVPHETGHQFGLAGDSNTGEGIMSVADPSLRFVAKHINVMRWRINSPGE